MSKQQLSCSPALALLGTLAALGCGGPGSNMGGDVDPYNGVIDNTLGAPSFTGTNTTAQGALAVQFQPTIPSSSQRSQCNNATSCYLPQTGYVNGQSISFFNAGVLKPLFSSNPPPYAPATCAPSGMGCAYAPAIATHASDGGGGWSASVFPHSCTAAGYDPITDAYTKDLQFPIVSALPINNLALTSPKPPLGVVAVYGVTGVQGETCNDLKYWTSVGDPTRGAGHFGATRSAAPTGYEVWMVFDPTLAILATTGPGAAAIKPNTFWFNGLQGAYLSGGPVPTDAAGNLVAMDGVIVAYGSSSFGDPTANKVIVLPYQPGDDGYSPIVRLHDYKDKGSHSSGFYNAVCLLGQTCTDSGATHYVKLSDATPAAFNTVFLVASPQ